MSSLEDRRNSPRRRAIKPDPHYYRELLMYTLVGSTLALATGIALGAVLQHLGVGQ